MKVSVICTVKNEERSIKELLDSLLSQSRPPDEIIIVDGGSTDNTVKIIEEYSKQQKIPIVLIVKNGVNRSKGRNIAIENAKYEYIASIDGGCRADKDWLKNLMEKFKKCPGVYVVAGFFLPDPKSLFEEVVGDILYPKLERIDPEKFLPSARSIAFKKECWEKVGGFPEWLETAEDTIFDLKLKESGCKFAFAKDAVVYWRPRSSLKGLFKQYYMYAKGATLANITETITLQAYGVSIVKYLTFVIRYCITLLKKRELKKLFYVPLILIVVSLAKFFGIVSGLLQRYEGVE